MSPRIEIYFFDPYERRSKPHFVEEKEHQNHRKRQVRFKEVIHLLPRRIFRAADRVDGNPELCRQYEQEADETNPGPESAERRLIYKIRETISLGQPGGPEPYVRETNTGPSENTAQPAQRKQPRERGSLDRAQIQKRQQSNRRRYRD